MLKKQIVGKYKEKKLTYAFFQREIEKIFVAIDDFVIQSLFRET